MKTYTEYDLAIFKGEVCPYCGKKTELIDSAEIYNGVSYGPIYICRDCDAYVGCYKNTNKSLGRLANAELREAKKFAHAIFDKIWKNKYKTRVGAYSWLSREMDVPTEFTHIGMFDVEQCKKVVELSIDYLQKHNI